jgi:Phage protein
MLHREHRVLGPEWKGWLVKPGGIVDPDGNETSRSQLHNYFWIVQLSRRIVYDRDDPRLHAEFEKLLDMG